MPAMAAPSTPQARGLVRLLVPLLVLVPLILSSCEEDETSTRSMATCPNELPATGARCEASQFGFVCTYVTVDDTLHCEARHEAKCGGNEEAPSWTVETDGCVGGGGGAGGHGGGGGTGGSSTSSTGLGGGGSGGGGFGGVGGAGGALGGGGMGGAGGA